MRDGLVSFLLTIINRFMLRRDRLNGRMRQLLANLPIDGERLVIASGNRRLSAVYLSAGDDSSAILICHGIGELVEYWGKVQGLLRDMGVSSLVFNYSGYGESSGTVSTAHCEEDAIAAYRELVDRGHSIHRSARIFSWEWSRFSSGFADRCAGPGLVRRIFNAA